VSISFIFFYFINIVYFIAAFILFFCTLYQRFLVATIIYLPMLCLQDINTCTTTFLNKGKLRNSRPTVCQCQCCWTWARFT